MAATGSTAVIASPMLQAPQAQRPSVGVFAHFGRVMASGKAARAALLVAAAVILRTSGPTTRWTPAHPREQQVVFVNSVLTPRHSREKPARMAEAGSGPSAGGGWSGATATIPAPASSEASGGEKWWEAEAKTFTSRLTTEDRMDSIDRLRKQMSAEESAFDQEIEDVVISGKKALLRLRMQKAVETPGMKSHLFKRIRKQIARALTLRREREIARGITSEQSRRMRRRKRLELKMQYEAAYGAEHQMPKSRKWLRRMGRIF